jgi:hypothetical protein
MDTARKSASAEASARIDSALNRSMMQLLDHVEYRLITGGEDQEAIYRLRYNSYRRSGMCGPIASGMFEDRWDNLPNAYRFGVYCYDQLVSTLRFHYVTSEQPYSPSVDAYPEVLLPRLARGETFIDGTRFAADPDSAPSPGVIPFLTLRIAMVASCYFGQDSVLTPVKMEHSAFYVRYFQAVQRTEAKAFPGVLPPLALFAARLTGDRLSKERFPHDHPFARADAADLADRRRADPGDAAAPQLHRRALPDRRRPAWPFSPSRRLSLSAGEEAQGCGDDRLGRVFLHEVPGAWNEGQAAVRQHRRELRPALR